MKIMTPKKSIKKRDIIVIHFKKLASRVKFGLVSAGAYLFIVLLSFFGSISGIAGRGENDLFGWMFILSTIPSAWLLKLAGIEMVISTALMKLIIINAVLLFAVGSALGILTGRVRKLMLKINARL